MVELVNMEENKDLPCIECPHRSACCRWGTWLSDSEGKALQELYFDKVFFDEDVKMWRTQVWNGRCVFFNGVGCDIHHLDIYPKSCKEFPWKDSRNPLHPRAFDSITCPEFKI